MHFVFHRTCPAYMSNIVEPVGAGRTRPRLRFTSTTDFSLPQLRTMSGEGSFSHAGFSAWNDLPMGVASNRQEEAIASSWILQKNDEADQMFSLQKTKKRQTGM